MAGLDQIRVVIFKEGDAWVAQCLEVDIGAQAQDLDTLQSVLSVVIGAEEQESLRVYETAFGGIDPAPKHFFDLWDRKAGEFTPVRPAIVKDDGAARTFRMALCA